MRQNLIGSRPAFSTVSPEAKPSDREILTRILSDRHSVSLVLYDLSDPNAVYLANKMASRGLEQRGTSIFTGNNIIIAPLHLYTLPADRQQKSTDTDLYSYGRGIVLITDNPDNNRAHAREDLLVKFDLSFLHIMNITTQGYINSETARNFALSLGNGRDQLRSTRFFHI